MKNMKNVTMVKDALYNTSVQCTRTENLWVHLNVACAYGRGIVNGMVSLYMGIYGTTFTQAFNEVKKHLPADFDIECIPESWREAL